MDTEALFNQGGVEVPNPNYNSRTKKYGVSPTIIAPYASAERNIADISFERNEDFYSQYSYKDAKKYLDYGIAPNKISPNLDVELAEAQGKFAKFGNAIAQTAVSEVLLGTALGISDIIDGVVNAATFSDNDYQNPVSKTLQQWQDKFNNEVAPIYTDPTKDIFNGGLWSAGWWASNIPSIMSSLTLLIPSMGITKGASLLLKGSKLASGTRTAVRALSKSLGNKQIYKWANKPTTIEQFNRGLEIGANAAISRTMENYQEGRQVYNDTYNDVSEELKTMSAEDYNEFIRNNADIFEGVDTNNKDEVAKAISKKAADTTFKMDYANTVFDVIQLYALRDIFGKGRLSDTGRVSAAKAQRKSLRYSGKTEDEIAKLEKARPFTTKAKDFISDNILAASGVIKAEASEGVEEAVNYIAQEEGMRVGKLILGKENPSSFDTRLAKYMQSPQLWESAFWGFLGGVVFQNLGSGLQRIQQTIIDKNEKELNEKTDEKKQKVGWLSLSQLPEIKRRVADIQNRSVKAAELASRLESINKNINPFATEEDGSPLNVVNENDKEALRQRALAEYRTDVTLSALNNGNYDMLREYFANDNVRKYLVEQGVVSEENSRQWQQETLQAMDDIKNEYDNQIINLNDISASSSKRVPLEYIQIAATSNIYQKQIIRTLQNQQASYLNDFNNKKNELIEAGKLDPNAPYEDLIDFTILFKRITELYDAKRQIQKDIKKNNTVANQISLQQVNKQINTLTKELYNNKNQLAIAQALYALSAIDKYNLEKGELDSELNAALTDAIASNKFNGIEKLLGLEKGQLNLSEEEFNKVIKDYNNFDKLYKEAISGEKGITQVNGSIAQDYANYTELGYLLSQAKSELILSKEDLDNFTNVMNNTMNEARVNAIDNSYNIIKDLSKKYGRNIIENAMGNYISNNYDDFTKITNGFTDIEKTNLQDALDVLNFSNPANRNLYNAISRALIEEELNAEEDKDSTVEIDDTETQNSSIQTPQNTDLSNNTSAVSETPTEQINGQIDDVSQSADTQQAQNQQAEQPQNADIVINARIATRDGKPFVRRKRNRDDNSTDVTLTSTNQAGVYELTPNYEGAINYDELYDKENGVSIIDNNYKITAKPLVKLNNDGSFSIYSKGTLSPLSDTKQAVETETIPKDTSDGITDAIRDKEQQSGIKLSDVPTDSSTGVSSETSPKTSSASKSSNSDISRDAALANTVARAFGDFINMNDDEIDFDSATKQVKDKLNKEDLGLNEEQLNNLIDSKRKQLEQAHNYIKNLKDKAQRSAAEMANAARYEENDSNQFSSMFTGAVERFVKEYSKTALVPTDNTGRYIINIRSLLKQFQEANGLSIDINNFYNILKNYLLGIGSARYVIDDYDDVINDNVIKNLNKTAEEIHNENNVLTNSLRVNINTLIETANTVFDDARRKKYFDILDSIKIGDTLSLRRVDNQLEITKNNEFIGTIGIPQVTEDGTFVQYNEGWRTDVKIDENGNIQSVLKSIFTNFFTSEEPQYKELRKIIQQAVLERGDISDKTLREFTSNNEIKEILANARNANAAGNRALVFVEDGTGIIDAKNLLNHLVKLWKYTTLTNDTTINKENILNNLDNWFKKLYNTYSTINNITENQDVTVSYINEGQVNRVTEDSTYNSYSKLNYSTKGIANINNAAIAVVNPKDITIVNIAGRNTMNINGWGSGSTIVALYSRNIQPDFVKAYGVSLTQLDRKNVPVLDKLYKAVETKLNTTFNNLLNDGSVENETELLNIIKSIINIDLNNKNRIPLFRAVKGRFSINKIQYSNNKNIQGYQISYRSGNIIKDFHIYTHGTVAPQIGYKDINGKQHWNNATNAIKPEDFAKSFMSFIENYCNVNISLDGITSENTNKEFDGFIKRTADGKLKVTITNNINNFDETYDSYNDFLLKNDLVKVNTEIVDGSNFSYRNSNQRANQVLYVDVKSSNKTPVEERNGRPRYIAPNSIKELNNKLVSIIDFTPDNENTGIAIAKELLSKDKVDELQRISNELGVDLLPNSIIFDNDINYNEDKKGIIAAAVVSEKNRKIPIRNNNGDYARKTGRLHTVYVGSKFINMASSELPFRRAKAIRKLIHEQLHLIISDESKVESRKALLNSIEGIYNDFKTLLNEYTPETEVEQERKNFAIKAFKIYEDTIKRNAKDPIRKESARLNLLEEFLVESLTNNDIYSLLNTLDATKSTDVKSKDNLFTRIINALLKFFGWDVRQGSLFEQELEALRGAFNNIDNTANTEEKVTTQFEVNEEVNKTEDEITTDESQEENEDTEDFIDLGLEDLFADDIEKANNENLDNLTNDIPLFSLYEESNIKPNNEIETSSLELYMRKLQPAMQTKLRNMVELGSINLRCR